MRKIFSPLFIVLLFQFVPTARAQASVSQDVQLGTRLPNFNDELKAIFPETEHVEIRTFVPAESGGQTFMGLIHRLLGERVNKSFEGMNTKRFIYEARNKDETIGIAHASTTQISGKDIDVTVFYIPSGEIQKISVRGVPPNVMADLNKGGYLKQFEGRNASDFEVLLGRRGRVRQRGKFHRTAKRPQNRLAKEYFSKIHRAVRFNTAFMEVAHFIREHPKVHVDEE